MFDVKSVLRERFDYAAYFYLSAWEHDPNMEIVNNTITGRDPVLEDDESRMIELFEDLRDSVDAIPPINIADIEARRAALGADRFEAILELAIKAVGRQSFPSRATDFAETLILNLQFANADGGQFPPLHG